MSAPPMGDATDCSPSLFTQYSSKILQDDGILHDERDVVFVFDSLDVAEISVLDVIHPTVKEREHRSVGTSIWR